jgi:hypothetical protein
MATLLIVHEVDDVDRWLKSPKREEVFGPHGFTVRTFTDPTNPNRVGLIVDGPGLDRLQELLQTDEGIDAMKHDGVRPETLVVLVER